MKAIFILFFISYPLLSITQSFVFCPQIDTEEEPRFENIKFSIVFDDSRTYEKKLNEKCTKREIFDEFTQCIKRTYPKMQLIALEESNYYKDPLKDAISLKVKFKKYDATFKSGTYNATTNFEVQIFIPSADRDSIIENIFEGKGKAFNTIGYGNCKSALNKSFKEAFDKFTSFLNGINVSNIDFKPVETSINNSNVTKADKLRELKKLLDEKILTQEEYDIEKKKILEEKY